MLKRLLVSTFLIIILGVAGCGGGDHVKIDEGNATKLIISRSIKTISDPYLVILAKEVVFDYSQRTITVDGLINITGDSWVAGYVWIVPKVSIQDNKLILKIPDDNAYSIYIGKNYHYLPIVKEK